MKVLAVIPARGGSKGIPRKNIKLMAGKPLIAWTIEAALTARGVSTVLVSTEDDEIASVAREWGAAVPFMRPTALALDATPGIDPVLHAIEQMPGYDAVLLLQPTSPLRTAQDIDDCLNLAAQRNATSVVSICESRSHPHWMFRMASDDILVPLMESAPSSRRQDLPAVYALNGALYFARIDWLLDQRRFIGPSTIGMPMPEARSIDIDTAFDWLIADTLLKENS